MTNRFLLHQLKQVNYRPFVSGTAGLPGLPEGWCWASMDELAQVVGGITKDSKQTDGRTMAYLRVANVQ